jgi:hypothetical protein
MDANTPVFVFIAVCVAILIVFWVALASKYRSFDKAEAVTFTALDADSNSFWYSLTSKQKEELNGLKLFSEQEDWIQKHAAPALLIRTKPEQLIISLATKELLILGLGQPNRVRIRDMKTLKKAGAVKDNQNQRPNLRKNQKKISSAARLQRRRLPADSSKALQASRKTRKRK